MAKALKWLGFSSAGSILRRAAMQGAGLMNDHLVASLRQAPASGAWSPLFGARYSRHTVTAAQNWDIHHEDLPMSLNSFRHRTLGTLILAGCSLLATLPAQAADRQDARDVRQEVRPEIREAKIDCREANNKDNYECRQDKREVKQDVREKSRDVKY